MRGLSLRNRLHKARNLEFDLSLSLAHALELGLKPIELLTKRTLHVPNGVINDFRSKHRLSDSTK